jgi:sn-glycerol 3-phosphate transport system ATP-binding protein
MNFLEAELATGGSAARLADGTALRFADGRRAGGDAKRLTVGIRPEHVALAETGLELLVDLIEPLGSETLVHGRLALPGEPAMVVKLAGPAPAGDRLHVELRREHLHVFDRATGGRIEAVGTDTLAMMGA